jgi:DNA polymerase-3 subunit beta
MRITVVTETLRNAVNAARRFAQVKSSVPILGTLLFKTDADGVTIGSHSLDCCLSVRVPAEVMSPGTVALSAEKVSGLLRAAAGVEVSIDAGNTTAVIRTGSRSRYTIPIFIADDFPPMLALKDSTPGVDLDPVAVATLLVPTIAISNDESRHWLCGLYLHSTAENKVAAVATDGFKLVMGTTDVDGDAFQGLPLNGLHKGVILPAMALGEIARLSKNAIINVATDGRVIQVHAGATIFTSKLVAGTTLLTSE